MSTRRISFSQINMTDKDLTIIKWQEVSKDIWKELLASLSSKGVGSDKMAEKLNSLLDATTINNNWDVMTDNKVQLDTLKLLLKLHWADISSNKIQINLFNNMPWKNDSLNY